jgi:bacterioferritin-associated ferredoxin
MKWIFKMERPNQIPVGRMGNLSVCALALGQAQQALAFARRSLQMSAHSRSLDWLRLARAAAACSDMDALTEACSVGTTCGDLPSDHAKAFLSFRSRLRREAAARRQAETNFCRRAFCLAT